MFNKNKDGVTVTVENEVYPQQATKSDASQQTDDK
jgi:hypothetical protein